MYASSDSRHFGPVPYGLIQGKVFFRVSVCTMLIFGMWLYSLFVIRIASSCYFNFGSISLIGMTLTCTLLGLVASWKCSKL